VHTIRKHVARCGGRVLTVEDHYREGGIGEAVAMALTDVDWSASNHPVIRHRRVAVDRLARSGAPEELLAMYGLSANCIRDAVVKLVKQQ